MATNEPMSGQEYHDITFALDKNLRSMGLFLRINPRTSYRYAYEEGMEIPGPIADLLRLLQAGVVTFEQIEKLRAAAVRKSERSAAPRPTKKKAVSKKK